jgi:hypothetical protein
MPKDLRHIDGRLRQDYFDDRLQVHGDPGLFADVAHSDLDFSERGLDRGYAILVRDGYRPASDEPAPQDLHTLYPRGATVMLAHDHGEQSREQDILFQR